MLKITKILLSINCLSGENEKNVKINTNLEIYFS